MIRLARRLLLVTDRFHGQHFFVRAGSAASHAALVPGTGEETDAAVNRLEKLRPGGWMMTPLDVDPSLGAPGQCERAG